MVKFIPLLLVAVSVATLTGCTQPVAMEAAPDAENVLCAEVSVRLPDTVADAELRETNAQGTGAWGTPAIALLQCGVEVPAVASLECREFEGVEWLIDPSDPDFVAATTFGRDPAVRVVIDNKVSGPGVILAELARTVSVIPATKSCL